MADTASTLTPWDVLADLYDREINAGMQSDWDGGVVVWIGGPSHSDLSALPDENVLASRLPPGVGNMLNPIRSITVFERDEFGQIAPWMASEARRLFPKAF